MGMRVLSEITVDEKGTLGKINSAVIHVFNIFKELI